MKLLLIKIVARRERGFSCNSMSLVEEGELSSSNFAKSLGVKEKKATSDPEIMAEEYNNSNTKRKAPKTSKEKAARKGKSRKDKSKNKLSGSSSNY